MNVAAMMIAGGIFSLCCIIEDIADRIDAYLHPYELPDCFKPKDQRKK